MPILYEKHDHIAVLTMSRPERLNAFNTEMISQLDEKYYNVESDDDVFVSIITGEGRSFVSGADISEMQNMSASEAKRFSYNANSVFLRLENSSKPIIAAINGYAIGGGCELAMACDIRMASDQAYFGQTEVNLGITPGFGGTQRLPRIIGNARAAEMIFTGKLIDAYTARDWGLVSEVYPKDELLPKAMETARLIASKAQAGVRQAKVSLHRCLYTDMYTGTAFEAEAFGICFSTEDQKNSMQAFLDKRPLGPYKNK
jgi:enoyl-CoA hydratase